MRNLFYQSHQSGIVKTAVYKISKRTWVEGLRVMLSYDFLLIINIMMLQYKNCKTFQLLSLSMPQTMDNRDRETVKNWSNEC